MIHTLNRTTLVLVLIIVLLASIIVYDHRAVFKKTNAISSVGSPGFLSPRIYAGILQPSSYLIFNLKPLQRTLEQYIESSNQNISLYVVNLRDGASIGINENREFDPLSLNKIPIAIIVLRNVERGELTLDTPVQIKQEFLDSTFGTLYQQGEQILTVRELLHHMLSESDNTATKTLMSLISFDEITRLSNYLNYYNPSLTDAGPSIEHNVFITTPKSTYNLFMSLYLSTILTPEHSEFILINLANTIFDIKSYARLPEEASIIQKYGSYYGNNKELFHSCGIMYLKDTRFFYCVMTQDIPMEQAHQSIGDIVNRIYTYIETTRVELENYQI